MKQDRNFNIAGYKISSELFTTGMKDNDSPCRCTSRCCLGGVFADVTERDRVLEHSDMIAGYMDETQPSDPSQWFEDHESDDHDFVSGRCVGTTEYNSKCAFLDRHGRCSLQVAATEEGMHRWALKPLYCVLFPIEVSDKVVAFDDMLQDDEQCCSVSTSYHVPLFQSCRDELIHLLGEEAYSAMEDHFREHYKKRSPAGGVKAHG
ncbi:MAG: DUF3109 family protein [Ignavibacteria bacterium]|nr:DUF3109 family protein [Ignavibacteria bacterium]